jgi:hypothetical protein
MHNGRWRLGKPLPGGVLLARINACGDLAAVRVVRVHTNPAWRGMPMMSMHTASPVIMRGTALAQAIRRGARTPAAALAYGTPYRDECMHDGGRGGDGSGRFFDLFRGVGDDYWTRGDDRGPSALFRHLAAQQRAAMSAAPSPAASTSHRACPTHVVLVKWYWSS